MITMYIRTNLFLHGNILLSLQSPLLKSVMNSNYAVHILSCYGEWLIWDLWNLSTSHMYFMHVLKKIYTCHTSYYPFNHSSWSLHRAPKKHTVIEVPPVTFWIWFELSLVQVLKIWWIINESVATRFSEEVITARILLYSVIWNQMQRWTVNFKLLGPNV